MNEVFLGLGGNKGQRLAILKKALTEINEKIGKIVKVSSVYETQPWGSKSKNLFLNQVVKVETNLSPLNLLHKIALIEKENGRKRTKVQNSDRTLDIDILFFNNQIIHLPKLKIPHPSLHLRKFVIYPLCEIEKDLIHPELNQSIAVLKANCRDKLIVKKLEPEKPFLICVEGNIGVGKTTIAKILASTHRFNFIAEQFTEIPFLPLFYQDPKRYAFSLEWSFFLSRYSQLMQCYQKIDQKYICDFSIYRSLWFASFNLNKKEFALFKKNFNQLTINLPQPNLIVYLKTNNEQLIKNINQRNRAIEKEIKKVYLKKINRAYEAGFKNFKEIPILEISIKKYDAKSQANIIKTIENKLKRILAKTDKTYIFND